MSRDAAKMLLDTVIRHAEEQDAMLVTIKGTCTDEDFDSYRTMIGKSMGAILVDVVNPIVAKYPDLKPPQLK